MFRDFPSGTWRAKCGSPYGPALQVGASLQNPPPPVKANPRKTEPFGPCGRRPVNAWTFRTFRGPLDAIFGKADHAGRVPCPAGRAQVRDSVHPCQGVRRDSPHARQRRADSRGSAARQSSWNMKDTQHQRKVVTGAMPQCTSTRLRSSNPDARGQAPPRPNSIPSFPIRPAACQSGACDPCTGCSCRQHD